MLGLYDERGSLEHVGVTASFTDRRRQELARELEAYREGALDGHPWRQWAELASDPSPGQRLPGAKSRWNATKDLSWEPLRPELVVEVTYDHMQGARFRHTAQLKRFRTDKPPAACTYAQLEVVPAAELEEIFRR